MIEIRPASGADEQRAVYELRYQVIVEEQNCPAHPSFDHVSRTVIDPADQVGRLFVAVENEVVVGSLRSNLLRDGFAEPFSTLMGHHSLPESERVASSFSSRFVVARSHRTAHLGLRIARFYYDFGRDEGIKHDYILIQPALKPMYSRQGYLQVGDAIREQGVGELIPMRLDLESDYLFEIRSFLVMPIATDINASNGHNIIP